MDRNEITLDQLIQKMEELGEHTESGLCEVLEGDDYFYIHGNLGFNHVGAFYVYLQGGLAVLPVSHIYADQGFEQIDIHDAHMFRQDDVVEWEFLMERTQKQLEVLNFVKEKNRIHFLFQS